MKKILVIDDEPLVRYTLTKILRKSGYDVVTAADGARGITLFRLERPDVVITDLIMPEQEGIETIIKMKRERPEVKIIAISGGSRIGKKDFLRAAQALGADDTISKPFDAEELLIRLGHRDPISDAMGGASPLSVIEAD